MNHSVAMLHHHCVPCLSPNTVYSVLFTHPSLVLLSILSFYTLSRLLISKTNVKKCNALVKQNQGLLDNFMNLAVYEQNICVLSIIIGAIT